MIQNSDTEKSKFAKLLRKEIFQNESYYILNTDILNIRWEIN